MTCNPFPSEGLFITQEGFNQMSEGTLGFPPKGSSQVCLQVRTLQLSQTCLTGLPAQPRTDKPSCG